MEKWMDANGCSPGGAAWESYLPDPGDYPDPADWRTEVYWPIATDEVSEHSAESSGRP